MTVALQAAQKKPVRIVPTRASAGVKVWYSTQLQRLIDAMAKDIEKTITPIYASALAMDATPEQQLSAAMKKLGKKWNAEFNKMSKGISEDFANKATKHTDTAFRYSLKKGGFTVPPQVTKLQAKALPGIVEENVSLIKSIPSQHLEDVQRDVMDSVLKGRDMAGLTKRLHERHGVTKRRAQLIARDQNNKATSLIERTLQKELGLKKAIWVHTSASVHPRPEHMEFDGQEYDVEEGMWSEEDGEFVWPGTPINCGCTSSSIIPGYEE